MKILISGYNGFLGQSLKKHYEDDHTVVGIDRDLLNDPAALEEFMKKEKPDYIFHTAAYGNHAHQQDMDEIVTTNIIKTFFMMRASREVDYKAFINVGSSSEYGMKDMPMSETLVPETDTFYGASKVAGTYLARAFAKQFNKPIVTVRPFSLYGEGDSEKHFIPTIARHIKNQEPMKLVPHPSHDWIYIQDFLNALDVIIKNIDKLHGNIINIGTGVQYTNSEVVEKMEKVMGKEAQVELVKGMRDYDHNSWVADRSFLTSLGFEPQYTLLDGLTHTYGKEQKTPQKNS